MKRPARTPFLLGVPAMSKEPFGKGLGSHGKKYFPDIGFEHGDEDR
jgi:hypothetical protein